MELDRDFSESIACCGGRDVRFLIVGGDALAARALGGDADAAE